MDTLSHSLGWIGNIGHLSGAWYLTRLRPLPSIALNMMGNVCYGIQSIRTENWPLLILETALFLIGAAGLWSWSRIK